MSKIITGLDLGTTKVCAVIAEMISDKQFRVLGYGVSPSEGLTKGIVINIGKTAESIREAVQMACASANITEPITSVNVGVAGEHIMSLRHRNFVTIVNEEHEITKQDLERLDEDVRRIRIPMDMQILHVIPEEYVVDSNVNVQDPVGLVASKLEATNHVVLASVPAIQNIKRAIERAGFEVNDFILQPLASAASILDDNEKDLGVMMIDIGGGTTDLAIIHRRAIVHSKVVGIAGNQITNDIREALGVVPEEAEFLKKEHGYATESAIIKNEEIMIKGVGAWGSSRIETSLLTQIINHRMRELFSHVDNEIRSLGLKSKIRAGIILTGGGSLLRGTCELAEEIFGLPARLGVPLETVTGSYSPIEKPEYATVIGLLGGSPGQKIQPKKLESPVSVSEVKEPVKPEKEQVKRDNPLKEVWKNISVFFKDL
ncbi:MAG: cell division protein FtsA [Ignavibacteria bacterium]|nr:cell division protein FtsA [Ignavibacteria bacterium]